MSHAGVPCSANRKPREGNIDMSKYIVRCIRYIVPLVVLLLIAAYLILSPAMFTHAAGVTIQHIAPALHSIHQQPSYFFRP